jgi:ketosteroid isomerase-like protein
LIMSEETRDAIQRFHDAFNAHDIEAVARCISDDCIFEDTTPPDGTRYEGRDAMLGAVRSFFAASPAARFEIEELITTGDRALGSVARTVFSACSVSRFQRPASGH